ncbi:hypothetical protein KEM39_10875 [Neisseria sp. Marseille-Q1983]|uniref:hypothetical protein n=1 Tax=Neisseria sp. Marseille-Q1983 TaxID=2830768 RepID=UPI001BA8045C|nr:hypothetical protein [Neisseria sp. Marseille-Q1983]
MTVGALMGGAVDIVFQVAENYLSDKPLDCINWNSVAVSAAIGGIIPAIPGAATVGKCAWKGSTNLVGFAKNKSVAKELGKKYTKLFGKQGAKNARHKVGKQLGKATKAATHNLSNIKKYAAIGAAVAATSQIAKAILGGEKKSVFSDSPCG